VRGRLGGLGWVRVGRAVRVLRHPVLGSQAYGLARVLGRRLGFLVRSVVNKYWPGPAVCIFCEVPVRRWLCRLQSLTCYGTGTMITIIIDDIIVETCKITSCNLQGYVYKSMKTEICYLHEERAPGQDYFQLFESCSCQLE
jgi:hypothetical protein